VQPRSPNSDITALVLSAIGSEEASVPKMLKCIAGLFDAQGCGLWEIPATTLVSDFNPEPLPPSTRLLTISAWWEGDLIFGMDDVPLRGSPTADVAQNGTAVIIKDIQDPQQGGPKSNDPFWRSTRIRGMCAASVQFIDKNKGAINIYRKEGQPEFTPEEMHRLVAIAAIIPGLYRAVREKVELRLVKEVEELLREKDESSSLRRAKRGAILSKKKMFGILNTVCTKISEAFDCVETSIFLEESESRDSFRCAATTAPACIHTKVYKIPEDSGRLTGHVLYWRDSFAISDLRRLNSDSQIYVDSAFDINLRGFEQREAHNARRLLKLENGSPIPPLTFMAVPILGDDLYYQIDLCGAIRCHMGRNGLFYFGQRELDLLRVVARQIGKWWAAWRTRSELEAENSAWNLLGQKFDDLNTFALSELNKESPDTSLILEKGLAILENIIPGAELNGIRLWDAPSKTLQFSAFGAKASQQLGVKVDGARKKQTVQISRSHLLGLKVYSDGKVIVKENVHKVRGYSAVFPAVKRMVIAPIGVENHRFGVLDLRWTNKSIPPYTASAARLMGQQLGLYLRLAQLVAEVQTQKKNAERNQETEKRIYEDFNHQLKSPLILARIRVEEAVNGFSQAPKSLLVARGQLRRANRVATSMRLLAALSKGEALNLKSEAFIREDLLKRIHELAQDTEELYHSQLKFVVNGPSFYGFSINGFQTDLDVLEQLLGNILENAGKYGRPGSVVQISGGQSVKRDIKEFFVATANFGIPLLDGEAEKTKVRGWRSFYARGLTMEGQGIGLWLVDQVMQRQNGNLEVIPRNTQGMTEFRLVFRKNISQ
jgi:signal transduction histidine kinase